MRGAAIMGDEHREMGEKTVGWEIFCDQHPSAGYLRDWKWQPLIPLCCIVMKHCNNIAGHLSPGVS